MAGVKSRDGASSLWLGGSLALPGLWAVEHYQCPVGAAGLVSRGQGQSSRSGGGQSGQIFHERSAAHPAERQQAIERRGTCRNDLLFGGRAAHFQAVYFLAKGGNEGLT